MANRIAPQTPTDEIDLFLYAICAMQISSFFTELKTLQWELKRIILPPGKHLFYSCSIHCLNLNRKSVEPTLTLVKPAMKKETTNPSFAKLQPVINKPTTASTAPNTQVSKAVTTINYKKVVLSILYIHGINKNVQQKYRKKS